MAILTYDQLLRYAEGVSVNGSEGLGGHAEGFEQQNGGVTRRAPGEGPKVNGGRSQSQEMDSYDQPQYEGQEMPNFGTQDPEGWDRQVATGTNSRDQGVRDDVSIKEMFGMDESGLGGMRAATDRVSSKVDPTGMKDVAHRMDKLKKSSEKEKSEHPWASKKQATQIAKDHMKLGEQLRRTFLFKENPSPFSPFSQGADMSVSNVPTRSSEKPTIEEAHGEYVNIAQHYDDQFSGKNLDEIPEPVWKESAAFLSREPADLENYVSYLVGEGGELTPHESAGS